MACFDSGQVSVGTTATQVHSFPNDGVLDVAYTAALANMSTTDTVYLGSSSAVTTSTGFPLEPGDRLELNVYPDGSGGSGPSSVYGITEAGTVNVAWITGF